jgi:Protein of unknown function (DUF2752)
MAAHDRMTDAERRTHRNLALAALVVIVLAMSLEVRADQRAALRFWPDIVLPESCLSRTLLHFECAGCGLTRSFIYLAHGEFGAAWRAHRLGWLLALAVLVQIPYRLVALRTSRAAPLGRSLPRIFGWSLLVLLLVNWLMKLIAGSIN